MSPYYIGLAYEAPQWKGELSHWPAARPDRPNIRWRGNIAFVGWKPKGLRLVETAPNRWQLGWWMPARHKANRLDLFTDAGTWRQACDALARLYSERAYPVYPPMPFKDNAA